MTRTSGESTDSTKISPGINPQATFSHFTDEEMKIISRASRDWYVTNAGPELRLGPTSLYRYILVKPIDIFQEMFNIDREIVLVFSPYEDFQPRTLDAIAAATNRHQALRIERICSILVSKDRDIEAKLSDLLKNDQEAQIVVPFSYQELLELPHDDFFFRNRFKKHFYTRDLFASEAPLKKDLYFFGRTDLVHSLVNRHRSGQVSGLFGLRKTGKTSVIFGVQRALDRINAKSVFIDCQNPAFHRSRWNHALHYILTEVKAQNMMELRLGTLDEYTEEKAPLLFEKHIVKMSKELGDKSILFIFDEIENITFGISPSMQWRAEADFVYFWQTLRSLFQKLPQIFSYLIVGTNPICVEMEKVAGADNPLFAQIPIEYIPRFDVPHTREMVRRLGRIMGLRFDEILFGRLTEDFGGHPYLIRHVCSVINGLCPPDRPVRVDKTTYEQAKTVFLRDYGRYMDMILNVLKEFFNDEYQMLLFLARGDVKTFNECAQLSPLYTNHLLGYGILEENNGKYAFRIEAIRDHLSAREKYKKLELTQEEMWAEISERRNLLEQRMRRLCRMQLKAQFGEPTAREIVSKIMGEPRASKTAGLSFGDLFDAGLSGILFSDLIKLISTNWDCFKNILGSNKDDVIGKLDTINRLRVDAHAKNLTAEDFQMFRLSVGRIDSLLREFLGEPS